MRYLLCFLNLRLVLIHEHPQDGIDDMLGRHGLATFEVEGLNLMIQSLVYPHLRLGELTSLGS